VEIGYMQAERRLSARRMRQLAHLIHGMAAIR
jgi:hypothetical protein